MIFFFFKQKTAYEMRISDWSSDVCSSDLARMFAGIDLLGRCTGIVGVEELLPGERLVVSAAGPHVEQGWSPWDYVQSGKGFSFDNAAQALRETLKDSIGAWSTCFDHILVGASGGLDSSKIGRASCRERVCQYV